MFISCGVVGRGVEIAVREVECREVVGVVPAHVEVVDRVAVVSASLLTCADQAVAAIVHIIHGEEPLPSSFELAARAHGVADCCRGKHHRWCSTNPDINFTRQTKCCKNDMQVGGLIRCG